MPVPRGLLGGLFDVPRQGLQDAQAVSQDLRARMTVPSAAPKARQHRHEDIGLQHGQLGSLRVSARLFFFTSKTASSSAL